ncbi:hypothetical protein JCM10212_003191 [Sporobolomyces blumeae]
MPGRPFRSLSGLSGPQPTFAAQGKAKASQWGTKRAKAGRRVSRMDAFPDGQGSRLVESEERASSDDTEARPKRPPRSNSGAGKQARALAASRRASTSRAEPVEDRGAADDESEVSSVSSHSSDDEPDSDDPDRESSKAVRTRDKSRPVPKLPAFVDPRAELARRKARELSDPPTDAFSSSDGLGESSEEETGNRKRRKRKGPGTYKRGEDDFLDELDKIERGMKARKREYREQRRPGYSNPRKN